MNTLHLTTADNVEILVPVFVFADGSAINPTTSSVTVEYAVRDIDSTAALVYNAGSWELDNFSVWCAKSAQMTLAAGRYQYWIRVTSATGVRSEMTGILIVEAP